MIIQQRLLKFIARSNMVLLIMVSGIGLWATSWDFAMGIIAGGLIVTINFHLLYRTLKRSFTPPRVSSMKAILFKYYVRFTISGLIIFFLVSRHLVDPLGLFIGLSVVVASIILGTIFEAKKLICEEAA
jgi:hypothetical protein